jgi:hypothetical protein
MAVRPDGCMGLRSQTADMNQLADRLVRIGVKTSGSIGLGRLPLSFSGGL